MNMQVSQTVNFERTTRKNNNIAMTDEDNLEYTRTVERIAREKLIREGRKTKQALLDLETV